MLQMIFDICSSQGTVGLTSPGSPYEETHTPDREGPMLCHKNGARIKREEVRGKITSSRNANTNG